VPWRQIFSGRVGAAGPHHPTGERDKISRMQRELQRPEIEAKPDWHGRNEVEAIKNPEKNGLLRYAIYDLIFSLLYLLFFIRVDWRSFAVQSLRSLS
jgi:hypothetical protein